MNLPELGSGVSEDEVRKSRLFKNYQKEMKVVEDEEEVLEEEGLLITSESKTVQERCPVTLKRLDDPQRNPYCPHILSKEGVDYLIKKNSNSRSKAAFILCPVAGCKKTIPVGDFQPAVQVAREIARIRRKKDAARERATQQSQKALTK